MPSGTVTFLFTDLESSTLLWEDYPVLMSAALARHDELVHDSIGEFGGIVFSGMGDGVAAAFERATDAAQAAMCIQAAVTDEPWPSPLAPLRIRMGLHTGHAEIRDASYYGSAVNRAARVMAIAWGGQVVCTATTASLLTDELELCDLGEHRLRDLSRPEHVWQIGSASFPPLRSGSTLPGNLPTQLTEFVGREAELQRMREAVRAARIVTLTGVGGAGKTRLALQFAAEAQPAFRDGVWLCELAPLTSPDAVGPLVGGVLSVEPGDGGWADALAAALTRRRLLLVLDNCEHVLDAAASLADVLVRSCPEVVVVATSREGLDLVGERVIAVGSLGVPQVGDPSDMARATDAVSLFVSRARDVRPFAADDDDTIASIAGVCRRLDGIPLAIELAAARTRSLTVAEIGRHLNDRFRLLTRGAHAALDRHHTLRATIDWSFDLLSEAEQRVLARVSVFAGGFTLDAAAAVCDPGTTSEIDTLDRIDAVVRRSMLIAEEDAATTRYRMLETIRQYAAERLELIGEVADMRGAHLEWCSSFAREAGSQLRGPNDAIWIARIERELDNIRVALQFAFEIGDLDSAKTLLASMPIGALWDSRLGGSMAALAQEAAPILGEPDHPVSAALLALLAIDAARRFAVDEALDLAVRACTVARRHDDWLRTGPWLALLLSSVIAGRADMVMVTAEEALARAISDNDPFAMAEWHSQLGIAHWMAGDVEEAQRRTEIGLTLAEKAGAENLIMRNTFLRGVSLLVPGSDHALALQHFQRAVRLGERVGGNALYGGAAWAMLLSNRGAESVSASALAHELATNLPTPMFLADADGMLVFYNDAAASILGMKFADVGQIPPDVWATIVTPRDQGVPLPPEGLPLAIALRHRRPAHHRVQIRTPDGVPHQLTVTAIPLHGGGGENLGAAAIFWETP
jgi:predicted ATPase/class 3 adenylate cyclase